MKQLEIRVNPCDVGFDSGRLQRIQAHFDAYVADQRLSGWLATVARGGELVWKGSGGHRDRERGLAVSDDTIWRIFSMTKPVTSIAAMILYEEGLFDLNDDVGKWIEELREPRVYVSGPPTAPVTVPATEPVRVWHLLSHTSGLTYGLQHRHPVDAIYRTKGYDFAFPEGVELAQAVHDWCSTPLMFQPGSAWNYSHASEVLGRLIEIWSGQSLDVFFRERILDPLGMSDTDWYCSEEKQDRLAMLYVALDSHSFPLADQAADALRKPSLFAGGGGLVSTAGDYQRFMTMLLNGGELGDVRLVSSRTLELMTQNHLPNNGDLRELSRGLFSDAGEAGVGFGLGFSVMVDRVKNKSLVSEGTFAWGGGASTAFWVDPVEDITVGFYTQLLPSWANPIRRELRQLVYSALVD
jgi:CubicO group peptidase (beta-lactamase class C family)